MGKITIREQSSPSRDAFLEAQPLCEHSLSVGEDIAIERIQMKMQVYYDAVLRTKAEQPWWNLLAKFKLNVAAGVLRSQAKAVMEDE